MVANLSRGVFVENKIGIEEYLQSDPELRHELNKMAEEQLKWAVANAPVGDPDVDPESGAYRDSLEIKEHHTKTRMTFRVQTADYKRFWIEYGAAHMPKYRILGKSLEHVTTGIQL